MTKTSRQRVGSWGEAAAAAYLEKKGYQIMARNARTPYGEIDLVAVHAQEVVFVEVKTRTNLRYGYPEQAITGRKLEHMIAAAQYYIEEHLDLSENDWRIDVVAIWVKEGTPTDEIGFEHFENITG